MGINCIDVIRAAGHDGQRLDAGGRLDAGNNKGLAERLHPHGLVIGLQLPEQLDILGVIDGKFGFASLPGVALLVETAGWPLLSPRWIDPEPRAAPKLQVQGK